MMSTPPRRRRPIWICPVCMTRCRRTRDGRVGEHDRESARYNGTRIVTAWVPCAGSGAIAIERNPALANVE